MYVLLGGIKPLVDEVLGKPATRVYMGGCNWNCPYCYVPDVLDKKKCQKVNLNELVYLLQQIKGTEAIEITGGEPTNQKEALEMMCQVFKSQEWLVKVHSNGSRPGVIGNLVTKNVVDFLTLDVKAPLDDERLWKNVTGRRANPQKVRESIGMAHLRSFQGWFEVLVPVLPGFNDSKKAIGKIARDVYYCNSFVLRGFDPRHKLVNPEWEAKEAVPHAKLFELAEEAKDKLFEVDVVKVESLEKGEEMV
jgi:pyruvate formate lyase activating enzyme